MTIKYVHTNLVAKDWQSLAAFYVRVLGCKVKPPERNLKGEWLDLLTSLKNVHIRGIHLLLPGFGGNGPTLEIFQYFRGKRSTRAQANHSGYGHMAFAVTNVGNMIKKIEKNGGSMVGKRISTTIEGVGTIDVAYARDPEGNIIELQRWN
jgi:lactoylglutathione lyase